MDEATESDEVNSTRRRMLGLLGGGAAVGLAGCIGGDDDGDNETGNGDDNATDNGDDNATGNGDDMGNGDDNGEPSQPEPQTAADKAQAAWERSTSNPLPEDEDIRNQAYVEMEEATRDAAVLVPLYHGKTERFWYDYVDVPATGALGSHWQQHNTTSVEGDTELGLINSTFDEIDPIMSTDTASSAVITQIYENLTAFPNGVPELENQLLDRVEVSEDGTTWTFTIRDDVQFHDGSDLTAQDVKYSWRRSVESEFSERVGFTINQPVGMGIQVERDDDGNIVPDSLAAEVLDDQTLEISLSGPNPDVLDVAAYSSFAVIPEGYVGDIEGYDGEVSHDEFRTEVANGTGPFEFDFFTSGEEARVVRNNDYYGETADVESVHWEIIEDDDAKWTYTLEQNADIFGVPIPFYEPGAVEAETDDRGREVGSYGPAGDLNEEVNYVGVPELSTFYFGFNASNTERAARQAVAYVLNKPDIVDQVFSGRGEAAYSFLPPGLWPTGRDGYESFLENYPYTRGESDIQGAQSVLDEAGLTSSNPTELELTTYESEAFQTAAELIRDLLSGTGVEFNINQSQFSTLQDRGEDGDLQMYTLGWIWSWPAAPYGIFQLEPKNTNTSLQPEEANGFYLDWHTQLEAYE